MSAPDPVGLFATSTTTTMMIRKKPTFFNLVIGLRSGGVLAWKDEEMRAEYGYRGRNEILAVVRADATPPLPAVAEIPAENVAFIYPQMYAVPGGFCDHMLDTEEVPDAT